MLFVLSVVFGGLFVPVPHPCARDVYKRQAPYRSSFSVPNGSDAVMPSAQYVSLSQPSSPSSESGMATSTDHEFSSFISLTKTFDSSISVSYTHLTCIRRRMYKKRICILRLDAVSSEYGQRQRCLYGAMGNRRQPQRRC